MAKSEQLERLVCDSAAYVGLHRQLEEGMATHAYLVVSADKAFLREFLTFAAAAFICKKNGCFDCPSCARVLAGVHADVKIYPKSRDKILVADVNEMVNDCFIKSAEGGRKVYILTNCDGFAASAQNKLLKTLEEPPENVVFLLGASTESSVLATVRSRCQILHADDFSFEETMQYLTSCGVDEADAEIAAGFCFNRPLLAEACAADKTFFKMLDEVIQALKTLDSSKDALRVSTKLSSFGSDGTKQVLQMMMVLFREALMTYVDRDMLLLKHKKDDILFIAQKYTPQALCGAIELLGRAKAALENNCFATAVMDELVLSVLEVKYRCRK